jgi:hypothetical protein
MIRREISVVLGDDVRRPLYTFGCSSERGYLTHWDVDCARRVQVYPKAQRT